MGYAVSWLAVKAAAPEQLLRNLGLAPTGEMADYGDALFTGRTLSTGWFILFINQCEHKFVQPKTLASVSTIADVVACSIEEHVMWSTSELWRAGAQVWRIEHDAQKSMCHISTSGLLPHGYAAIEAEFSKQQEQAGGEKSDTDYFFEIPLQTARKIVGFKHDESGTDDVAFTVFKNAISDVPTDTAADQTKKPWWKPW